MGRNWNVNVGFKGVSLESRWRLAVAMALALAALRQFAISVAVLVFVVGLNHVPVSEAQTTGEL